MPSLVRTRQRVQRAARLPPHVVEHDDHREVAVVDGASGGRERCPAERSDARSTLPAVRRRRRPSASTLRPSRSARSARRLAPGAELLDDLRHARGLELVDDDEAAVGEAFVAARRARHRSASVEPPPIRSSAIVPIGSSASVSRGCALEEADAIVEEPEAREAVAHGVEIRWLVGHRRCDGDADGCEAVHDPDLAVVQLVRLEVSAQEDGAAAASGAVFDEVALDARVRMVVQASFEVLEADAAHRRVREVVDPRPSSAVRVPARRAARSRWSSAFRWRAGSREHAPGRPGSCARRRQ